jgi:hypothetical protein
MTKTTMRPAMSPVFLFGATWQSLTQSTTGTISGTVTDERQAVLPNATVTARNTEDASARTTS